MGTKKQRSQVCSLRAPAGLGIQYLARIRVSAVLDSLQPAFCNGQSEAATGLPAVKDAQPTILIRSSHTHLCIECGKSFMCEQAGAAEECKAQRVCQGC